MRAPRRIALALAVPVALAAPVVAAGPALAATTNLSASLSGAAETPKGAPSGSGKADVTVDTSSGQVCYTVTASGISKALAMHIHKGAAGTAGPVFVPLNQAAVNGAKTCSTTSAANAKAIVADPAGFYLNIHTAEFGAGAVRGQLSAAPSAVSAGSGGEAGEGGLPTGALVLVVGAGLAVAGVSARRLARR